MSKEVEIVVTEEEAEAIRGALVWASGDSEFPWGSVHDSAEAEVRAALIEVQR